MIWIDLIELVGLGGIDAIVEIERRTQMLSLLMFYFMTTDGAINNIFVWWLARFGCNC